MLSSGYFAVSKALLMRLGKDKARTFIAEMFNCGGRVGYHEYNRWQAWIAENVPDKNAWDSFNEG